MDRAQEHGQQPHASRRPARSRAVAFGMLLGVAVLSPIPVHAQEAFGVPIDTTAVVPESATPDAPAMSTPLPKPALGGARVNIPLSAVRMARLTGRPRTVLRTGPSEADAIAGVFAPGTTFAVLATSGDWINVRTSPTESGWVHKSLCDEFDDLSNVKMQANPRLYSRTGSYVLAGYAGGYAFDRKANSLALGGRLGYYVFDRLMVETGAAWTHVNRPAHIEESLFGLSLEAEAFHMLFYQLNATWEFLPGRQMVPFATVGVGSSIMQGRSESSFNYGAGTTLFLSKRTGMRWEARDYVFYSGSDNARQRHHNVEFSLGSLLLF